MQQSGPPANTILIVNTTIAEKLIRLVPADALKALLAEQHSSAPDAAHAGFGRWVKFQRDSTGLSQRVFATELKARGLDVFGPDISYIESGSRKGYFSAQRLERVRSAVIAYVAERAAKKTKFKEVVAVT